MNPIYYSLIGILISTVILSFIVNRFFWSLIRKAKVNGNTKLTNYQFLRRFLLVSIYLVGISFAIYTVEELRTMAGSILAGAGILAVAIGFASQQALSNVIGGIFIVVFKPFQVNDRLTIRGTMTGIVEDITLRHVIMRNFENQRIIIPNSVISEEIIVNPDFINDKICKWIDISIDHDSDIDVVKKIMRKEIEKHPLHVDPRTPDEVEKGDEEVIVRVRSLGDFTVNMRAWAWARNSPEGYVLSCDLYESIKKQFDKEGIKVGLSHQAFLIRNQFGK